MRGSGSESVIICLKSVCVCLRGALKPCSCLHCTRRKVCPVRPCVSSVTVVCVCSVTLGTLYQRPEWAAGWSPVYVVK